MKVFKHPAAQIGAAAVLGIVFGLIAGEWAGNLKFVGDIFIRLIRMAIVPLVMTSVIVATGSMSGSENGRSDKVGVTGMSYTVRSKTYPQIGA